MSEIIFSGTHGRLEGRFVHNTRAGAPIALILHPLPQLGGDMNHPITWLLYQQFVRRGFTVLRYNSRGVGKSQGVFDDGNGELSDAAAALDWLQMLNPDAQQCWVAGYSFGAWVGMQLLMRRPEISGFLAVAPPINLYDFSFLAPCPASGLIIHGDNDKIVPHAQVTELVERLRAQKGIDIGHTCVKGANHFFSKKEHALEIAINNYLDKRIVEISREIEEA